MNSTFREKITPALNYILCHYTWLVRLYMNASFMLTRPDRRLAELKDSHLGEKCFIVGLGPSLTLNDLDTLSAKRVYTFSMNRCYQLFSKTKWRPNSYLVSDAKACTPEAKRAMTEMLDGGTSVFYSRQEIKHLDSRAIWFKVDFDDFVLRNSRKEKYRSQSHFCRMSTDAFKGIYPGSTSVHSIIQIAYYMGFREIYLIGTDCGLSKGRNYSDALPQNANSAYAIGEGDLMIKDYDSMARDISDKHLDLRIFNATRGGHLEVFPRVDFDCIFPSADEK